MNLTIDHLELLATALLTVNNWPMDKVTAALPALHAEGLLDPARVIDADPGDLTVRLARAGYDRGTLTSMFAERLRELLRTAQAGKLDALPALVAAGREADAKALLLTVKGIGPRVADVAWQLLRG